MTATVFGNLLSTAPLVECQRDGTCAPRLDNGDILDYRCPRISWLNDFGSGEPCLDFGLEELTAAKSTHQENALEARK